MIYNLELSKQMFEQVKFSPVDVQYLRLKDILHLLSTNKLIFSVTGKIIIFLLLSFYTPPLQLIFHLTLSFSVYFYHLVASV